MKRSWRNEYRRCERCKADYHPQRQSQSYCSPACRRAAAYGRERREGMLDHEIERRMEELNAKVLSLGSSNVVPLKRA